MSVSNNRYGDRYWFEKLSDCLFTIKGNLKYWRYGGRVGQNEMDFRDLGFVDPSGGPFIELGMEIEGRKIVRISVEAEDLDYPERILFEVEAE